MHSSTILLSALAAVVSADMQHLAVPGLPKRVIQARQTADTSSVESASATGTADSTGLADPSGTSDPGCESAYSTILSLYTEIPTPAPDVASYIASYTATDDCTYSVPASLTSDYDAWTSDVLSWYSGTAGEIISSAISQCTDLSTEDSSDISGVCTSGAAGGSTVSGVASASATTTNSKGETSTGTAASETKTGSKTTGSSASATTTEAAQTNGAAMREAGAVGAVFAGVLGAVIAL